jgi:hypothetical protein
MAGIYGTDPQMRATTPATPAKSGRQRLADALMTMGSQFEPMQSWTQGLAKIAQGGIGGYMAGQEQQNAFNNDQSRIAAFGSAAGQGVQQPRQPFTFAAKDDVGSGQGVGRNSGFFGRIGRGGSSWPS